MASEHHGEVAPDAQVPSSAHIGDLAIVEAELGPQIVLNLVGDLSAENATRLLHRLQALRREDEVVLDLNELASVDAAGLGVLTEAFRLFRAEGGNLRLRNPTPDVSDALATSNPRNPFHLMLDRPV